MSNPKQIYLTTKQVAEMLGLSCSWLEKRRVQGDGPPYIKISPRRVLYARQELMDWIDSHQVQSTSEMPAHISQKLCRSTEAEQ